MSALPLVGRLRFVNPVLLGVIACVAPQIKRFAVGFTVTLGVGLVGMLLTLMQARPASAGPGKLRRTSCR